MAEPVLLGEILAEFMEQIERGLSRRRQSRCGECQSGVEVKCEKVFQSSAVASEPVNCDVNCNPGFSANRPE